MNDTIKKTVFAVAVLFLLQGCGSGGAGLSPKDRKMLEEQSVELMDLKSTVVIMQTELSEIQSDVGEIKNTNTQLAEILRERNNTIQRLEDKIGNLEKGRDKISSAEPMKAVRKPLPAAKNAITTSKPSAKGNYKSRYNVAKKLYDDSKYERAIARFSQLVKDDDSNDLSDNAQYWIGESYYGLENYDRAVEAFEVVLTFPQSNKNDFAQFKIGLCFLKLGQKQRAKAAFESFLASYPDSQLVPRVREYLRGIR